MKHCALLAGALLCTATLSAQSFDLGFAADLGDPPTISGAPGTSMEFSVDLTLTSADIAGDEGPQGWSLGVTNTGVELVGVTTDGTVAADVNADPPGLRNTGFEVTEVVDPDRNGGVQGLVSAIVLSFTMPIVLPPNQTDVIAVATYEATIGDEESEAMIEYANGLVGQGQPVDNNVTLEGASFAPNLGSMAIAITAPREDDCGDGVDNDEDGAVDCEDSDCEGDGACTEAGSCDDGIDNDGDGNTDCDDVEDCPADQAPCLTEMDCGDGVDNDEDGRTDCDDSDCEGAVGCEAAEGGFDLALAAGSTDGSDGSSFEVTAFIQPNLPDTPPELGAQGWSIGVEHDPAVLEASDATTSGTVAADVSDDPPGIRNGGFEKTEIVDPANNDGRGGVVSAIVLSFTMPITLDANDRAVDSAYDVHSAGRRRRPGPQHRHRFRERASGHRPAGGHGVDRGRSDRPRGP